MDDVSFDPTAFKAQQSAQWSAVAQGWRRRWTTFEQGAQPLSDRLMELAHVAPGQRVLDVATGIGEPALTAARRIGPSGSVVAIDQAPQMLAVARERMEAAGVANIAFVEGDAETLVLEPASFDAVVSRWGLLFFQDPLGALAHFRASLISGGWLAAAIWGLPERVPLISLPFMALGSDQERAPGGSLSILSCAMPQISPPIWAISQNFASSPNAGSSSAPIHGSACSAKAFIYLGGIRLLLSRLTRS